MAQTLLADGVEVYGVSRRTPDFLQNGDLFHFQSVDLAHLDRLESDLAQLFGEERHLDVVFLNAGILGKIQEMRVSDLDYLKNMMDINVWSNKIICDFLFQNKFEVSQLITLSSGASISGGYGWNGYAISKAALNMLTLLYARENPKTHFCALAPGLIQSAMQETISSLSKEEAERFDSIKRLQKARGTSDMPAPEKAARRIIEILPALKAKPSGSFQDLRKL